MKALIVVDVQNELSPRGRRPVPNHAAALAAIRERAPGSNGKPSLPSAG